MNLLDTASKLVALVPGLVRAGQALARLFGRRKHDPAVAESERLQTAAGEAARRESRLAGKAPK